MGLRKRWLGCSQFSWSDLRAIIRRNLKDPASELYRSVHPEDWMYADPLTLLSAKSATTLSRMASAMTGSDIEVFGPPQVDDPPARVDRSADRARQDRARRIAAEMRAEMAA